MRSPAKLSLLALLVLWSLLAASLLLGACGGHYAGWPFATAEGPGQLEYGTPEGDEVAVSCPVELPIDPTVEAAILNYPNVDPTKAAEVRNGLWNGTPVPWETAVPAGSLGALFPANPITGEPFTGGCSPESNAEVGCQFCGFFADEAELDRLGRLCGCNTGGSIVPRGGGLSQGYFSLRADLYLTTAGAHEAFSMEADTIRGRGFEDVKDVDRTRLTGLGDERTITLNVGSMNGQRYEHRKVLLVRWHNLIARMELSPSKPTELLLDYAEQLGRNLEAMAKGGGG